MEPHTQNEFIMIISSDMSKSSLHNTSILLFSGEVKLVTETEHHSGQELKGPDPWVSWATACVGMKKKKQQLREAPDAGRLCGFPHRSLLPCLQGKQDSARVQCFMSWSQPNSPHSHKHYAEGRDSGHATAAARPHGACTVHHNTYTFILTYMVCAHLRHRKRGWLTKLSMRNCTTCV